MITEKWLMKKSMHLGPLRDELKAGQIVEWTAEINLMRVGGRTVDKSRADPEEAARMLKALLAKGGGFLVEMPSVNGVQGSVKTRTSTMLPVLGCFMAASKFIGETLDFEAVNETQTAFLELFGEKLGEVDQFEEELVSIADKDVNVINAFLKEKGFDIKLDPVGDGFAVASVLDVLMKWVKEGTKTSVRDGKYPAVRLNEGVSIYMGAHGNPLIAIETKSDDVVMMTPVDKVPDNEFGVNELVEELGANPMPWSGDNQGVIFPMSSYDQKVDISWLKDLKVTPSWFIAQALQQTKFRMNEFGARAESAVAMSLRCCSASAEPEPIVIDRPFLLWVDRQGVSLPVFAGVFAEDVWIEPAGLD